MVFSNDDLNPELPLIKSSKASLIKANLSTDFSVAGAKMVATSCTSTLASSGYLTGWGVGFIISMENEDLGFGSFPTTVLGET